MRRSNMKLNKIQQQIYDEYKRTGRVWAEMPRQSGKTELLGIIGAEELLIGRSVSIISQTRRMEKLVRDRIKSHIYNKSKEKLDSLMVNVTYRDDKADVWLYDEKYMDMYDLRKIIKLVCVRTREHMMFLFTAKDVSNIYHKKFLKGCQETWTQESYDIAFNGGIINKEEWYCAVHEVPPNPECVISEVVELKKESEK